MPGHPGPPLKPPRNHGTVVLVLLGGLVVFLLATLVMFGWALGCESQTSPLPACDSRLDVSWTLALLPTVMYLGAAVPTLRTGHPRPATRAFAVIAGLLGVALLLLFLPIGA